jgi:predicted MFS family arabinose efflux permease
MGLLAGPIIGTGIFYLAGYAGTFYIFGGIIFIAFVICFISLPNRINQDKKPNELILDQNPLKKKSTLQGRLP